MSIDIVTHCYAKRLPQYAAMLHYQLHSILHHPVSKPVTVRVCFTDDDKETAEVFSYYEQQSTSHRKIKAIRLPEHRLFPRAVGRNLACEVSLADVIWFTDVDHYFGEGCLDSVYQHWAQRPVEPYAPMFYSNRILISKNHVIGDKQWQRIQGGDLSLDPSEFRLLGYRAAIGGVMMVDGDYARRHGYLKTSRRNQKGCGGEPFQSRSSDDIKFRKQVLTHGKITPMVAKNLYRIRHSTAGRYVQKTAKEA